MTQGNTADLLLRGTLELLLLQALRDGQKHGYAIARFIEKETADVLGISESNVGARLTRARQILRQLLQSQPR